MEICLIFLLIATSAVLSGDYRRLLRLALVPLSAAVVVGGAFLLGAGSRLLERTAPTWKLLSSSLLHGRVLEDLGRIAYYRVRWWPAAARMFEESPATGIGIGAFPFEMMNRGVGFFDSAGNFYLQVAAELGVPGLILIAFSLAFAVSLVFRLVLDLRQVTLRFGLLALGLISATAVFGSMLAVGSHLIFHEVAFLFAFVFGALSGVRTRLESSRGPNGLVM